MENPTLLSETLAVQNPQRFNLRLPQGTQKNYRFIQSALQKLLDSHSEVLTGAIQSPEEVCNKLGIPFANISTNTTLKKGKWISAAERLKNNSMSPEAAKIMNEAIKEFRETFAIGDSFDKE